MGSLIDLTGQRFGRLVVLGYAEKQEGRTPRWTCKCDCGNVKDVAGRGLREGHIRSCGCLAAEQREKTLKSKMKNVSNIKFDGIPEDHSIPNKNYTRIEKLPTYVGACLKEFGNTVLEKKYEKIGANNIIKSIKKQFGLDVVVHMTSTDSLIVELSKSKYEAIKQNVVTGFDEITKRYP